MPDFWCSAVNDIDGEAHGDELLVALGGFPDLFAVGLAKGTLVTDTIAVAREGES